MISRWITQVTYAPGNQDSARTHDRHSVSAQGCSGSGAFGGISFVVPTWRLSLCADCRSDRDGSVATSNATTGTAARNRHDHWSHVRCRIQSSIRARCLGDRHLGFDSTIDLPSHPRTGRRKSRRVHLRCRDSQPWRTSVVVRFSSFYRNSTGHRSSMAHKPHSKANSNERSRPLRNADAFVRSYQRPLKQYSV